MTGEPGPDDDIVFRTATSDDIANIVRMLADDPLGAQREIRPADGEPPDPKYLEAFAKVDENPYAQIIVAVRGDRIVGTLQINLISGLSRAGLIRGQIESVRVAEGERGSGLGARLINWAIDHCREAGCGIVQLTSDRSRTDAHRFYERLGFVASHTGFKLIL